MRALCLAFCVLLTGCAIKPETYPVVPDYTAAKEALFEDRPSDTPSLVEVNDLADVMRNSIEYQRQMEHWVTYAVKLENWIKQL